MVTDTTEVVQVSFPELFHPHRSYSSTHWAFFLRASQASFPLQSCFSDQCRWSVEHLNHDAHREKNKTVRSHCRPELAGRIGSATRCAVTNTTRCESCVHFLTKTLRLMYLATETRCVPKEKNTSRHPPHDVIRNGIGWWPRELPHDPPKTSLWFRNP